MFSFYRISILYCLSFTFCCHFYTSQTVFLVVYPKKLLDFCSCKVLTTYFDLPNFPSVTVQVYFSNLCTFEMHRCFAIFVGEAEHFEGFILPYFCGFISFPEQVCGDLCICI